MCLIQDVPTLGRHPVKRVHAAVPSAAEDDFPCLRDKSARSCLRPSADGLSEPLDADHAPCHVLGCAGETVRMRSLALYPSAALGPTCRSGRAQAGKVRFDANDQKTQRVIKIWQTFPGLGISHIPAAPRPSDVAPGRRWNSTSAAHGHPGARTKAPEHLRATGLQTAPAWRRINARAGHPVTGRAWPVMLAPVGEFFLVDFQVQLGNARLQPFLHVGNRPVVDDRRDFLQEESQQRRRRYCRSALPCSGRNTAGSTRPPYRAVPVRSIGILPASVCIHEGYETRTKRAAGQRMPGRAASDRPLQVRREGDGQPAVRRVVAHGAAHLVADPVPLLQRLGRQVLGTTKYSSICLPRPTLAT